MEEELERRLAEQLQQSTRERQELQESADWWKKEKAKADNLREKVNQTLAGKQKDCDEHNDELAQLRKKLMVSSKGTQLLTDMLQEAESRYGKLVENIEKQSGRFQG